ncbi:MAG: thermostable hemolysin delta-VPH [Clostridia bacterium]|nr:thermostable hemolysin delta-VPH [Clostridia bacterium]
MTYFNYHAKVKALVKSKHCISVSFFKSYHNIKPAMVFYFDNHQPMPIRDYMWKEYFPLIKQYDLLINNPDKIDLDEFA